jgi:hypothetical protein
METLLSDDLRARLGMEADAYGAPSGGDAILPPRRKATASASAPRASSLARAAAPASRQERRAAKRKVRKVKSVVVKHEVREQRAGVYASLAASGLTREQQALLLPSGALGHAPTAREALSRQLRLQRAGLAEGDAGGGGRTSSLLQRAEGSGVEEDEEEEEEEAGGDGDGDDGGSAEEEGVTREQDSAESDHAGVWGSGRALPAGKRAREPPAGEGAPAAAPPPPPPPSSFAFKVSLGGGGEPLAVPPPPAAPPPPLPPAEEPPAQTAAPADLLSDTIKHRFRVREGGAGSGGGGRGGRKVDEAQRKLEELRARNAAEAAAGGGGGGGDAVWGAPPAEAVGGRGGGAPAALPAGHSAYLAVGAWSSSSDEEGVRGGGGGGGAKKRALAAREAVPDELDLRRAMWDADGRARVVGAGAGGASPPASFFSAYETVFTPFPRPPAAVQARGELPVTRMEQEIMEALGEHDVLIVAGETGSGKTTQVPQFLLEAGYGTPRALLRAAPPSARPHAAYLGVPGMVAVTQPRRVAATAMAARVAAELGCPLARRRGGGGGGASGGASSGVVGYQVRFDSSTVTPATRLKFVTDGLLLRELRADLLLRQYSAIVIDEAHERNVNTDVLLGLLSRLLPLRNRLAREAAAAATAAAAAAGGARPPADHPDAPLAPLKLIIMSATLRTADFTENEALFPGPFKPPVMKVESRQFPVTAHFSKRTELVDYVGAAVGKVCRIHAQLPPGGVLVFLTGQEEVEEAVRQLGRRLGGRRAGGGDEHLQPRVLPLFAMLPRDAQDRVFKPTPEGQRLIVVATNVAETSLTIPGIRCVRLPPPPPHTRKAARRAQRPRPCRLLAPPLDPSQRYAGGAARGFHARAARCGAPRQGPQQLCGLIVRWRAARDDGSVQCGGLPPPSARLRAGKRPFRPPVPPAPPCATTSYAPDRRPHRRPPSPCLQVRGGQRPHEAAHLRRAFGRVTAGGGVDIQGRGGPARGARGPHGPRPRVPPLLLRALLRVFCAL